MNWIIYATNFWFVLVLLWIAVILAGFIGFGEYSSAANLTVLDRGYLTTQLFFGNYPGSEARETFWLELARFGAIVLTFTTVITALGVLLFQKIALWYRRVRGEQVIICGLGTVGTKFVEEYERLDTPVIVIEADPDHPMLSDLRRKGILIITGDATYLPTLEKAGVCTAKHLIAATGSDRNNAIIGALCEELREHTEREFICYIHIRNPGLCNLTQEICFEKYFSHKTKTLIEPINIYQFGGMLMLEDFPPFPQTLGGTIPHILIVGGGKLGESLIRRLPVLWQDRGYYTAGMRFHLTLIDRDADELIEQITAKNPELERYSVIDHHQIDIWSADFLRMGFLFEGGNICRYSAVYVCLADEETSIYAGLEIYNALRRPGVSYPFPAMPKIVVRTSFTEGYNRIIDQAMNSNLADQKIDAFPLIDRTCSPEYTEYGFLCEIRARAIHEDYIRLCSKNGFTTQNKPRMKPFEELDDGRCRVSNREQAKNQIRLLEAINCHIRYQSRWMPEASFEFSKDEIEYLAEREHDRWLEMMVKFRKTPRKDLSAYPARETMVPYHELSESWKEYDRDVIRNLPKVLSRVNMRIVRKNESRSSD